MTSQDNPMGKIYILPKAIKTVVRDAALQGHITVPVHITDTLMLSAADRTRVAAETLGFAATLRQSA